MILIVDANVVIKWFVDKELLHAEARQLLVTHQGNLEAPDFVLNEVANAAQRKHRLNEISLQQASNIVQKAPNYIDVLHPSRDLLNRAFQIAVSSGHKFYDCIYVACAEATGGILVTADEKLLKKFRQTEWSRFTCHLAIAENLEAAAVDLLTVSEAVILEIIRASEFLKDVRMHVARELADGELTIFNPGDMDPVFNSPSYHKLCRLVENLGEFERADILALSWYGRELKSKENTFVRLHHDARNWIAGHSADTRHLTYVADLAVYLKDGLSKLNDLS